MLLEVRNRLFEEKVPLIDWTMRRYGRIIRICHLCGDDIRQELVLHMLESLEQYDMGKQMDIDVYLLEHLRRALFLQIAPSERYGVPGAPKAQGFQVISLEGDCFQESYTEEKDRSASQDEVAQILVQRDILSLPKHNGRNFNCSKAPQRVRVRLHKKR